MLESSRLLTNLRVPSQPVRLLTLADGAVSVFDSASTTHLLSAMVPYTRASILFRKYWRTRWAILFEDWKMGPNRAACEPDNGRRGKIWIHAAFVPATGQAAIIVGPSRDSASYPTAGEDRHQFPAERWLIVEDNSSTHTSRQTRLALAAWPEIPFIPKQVCGLDWIERWFEQLRSLALKGRHFETPDELTRALNGALDYWKAHRHPYRWKKKPREQVTTPGGFGVNADASGN